MKRHAIALRAPVGRASASVVVTLLALMASGVDAIAGEVVPTDGMVITEDTTFVPGTYALPNGVSIGASGVTLEMNGAELVGAAFENFGVTCSGFDDVVIENGVVHDYYYAVFVKNGTNVTIRGCDLSFNWVDPESLGENAPFLDINVGPDLGDRVNLGGGVFMLNVTGAAILDNVLSHQENGMDLYRVAESLVSGNTASDNTGWGIHLNECTSNVITGNTADRCTREGLGDSAGVLLVNHSDGNQILENSFQHSGDGFFIGNEHGCPSNDNLVRGNDGSFAGANAFEATFSSGNRFHDNQADGSNYGFWLGYSHSGNEIIGNSIRANNVNGIEIEHGQDNVIVGNTISGNGGSAIVLRTDGVVHFPPEQFPCLELPAQELSRGYDVRDNVITSNLGVGIRLTNTTDSAITNNLVASNVGGTAISNGAGNVWSIAPVAGENVVGGPFLGGNYWDDYDGVDTDDDGIGDTELPYTNGAMIALPGDEHPLIGDPDVEEFENPMSLCQWRWTDLGRNTRTSGQTFNTQNGTHFATDGTALYLLEGADGPQLSRFDAVAARYEPRADAPEAVWDGGGFQHGGATSFFATVGVQFNAGDGSGKGPRLYRYEAVTDTWTPRADSVIGGDVVANEALAYDPTQPRLYATIVGVINGGDATLRRRLAIYDVATDTWIGATAATDHEFGAGSEAEHLDGKIYVWRGGFDGGTVNGSDSWLDVYDIAGDTWSTTPSLLDSGVIGGFRSGAFDIWGATITADAARARLFVQGGETNRRVYVLDVNTQTWSVAPVAVYDGGWGDGLEYVAAVDALYQIDGRSATGAPQGTAVLASAAGDVNDDDVVDFSDILDLLAAWGPCPGPCCPADFDHNGSVDFADLLVVLANWT